MGPTHEPQQTFMPHCWEPPSPFSSSSATNAKHQIPQAAEVQERRVPLTRFSPRQCTAERLRMQQDDCFSLFDGLSVTYRKLYCIPLYCDIVRPHLEYAMEANAPTLRVDINQLERAQRLATWLVRGLRYVPNSLTQTLLAGTQPSPADLIVAYKWPNPSPTQSRA